MWTSANEVRSFLVLRPVLQWGRRIDARVVLPGGHVEQAGALTERRRVPVRPALIAWIGRLSLRLRRLLWAAALVELAHSVDLHKRLSEQEPSSLSIEHIEVAVAVRPGDHVDAAARPVVDEHR